MMEDLVLKPGMVKSRVRTYFDFVVGQMAVLHYCSYEILQLNVKVSFNIRIISCIELF